MDGNGFFMQIAPLMAVVACMLILQIGGIVAGLVFIWRKVRKKP